MLAARPVVDHLHNVPSCSLSGAVRGLAGLLVQKYRSVEVREFLLESIQQEFLYHIQQEFLFKWYAGGIV